MTEETPSPNAVSPDIFQAFIDNISALRGKFLSMAIPTEYEIQSAIASAEKYRDRCKEAGQMPTIHGFIREETDIIYGGQSFNDFSPGNDGGDAMAVYFDILRAAETATDKQYPTAKAPLKGSNAPEPARKF